MAEALTCRRCRRPVVASAADYEIFEQMHYVCFHYEFEHEGDPDVECGAGGCPARGITLPSPMSRIEGVDIAHSADDKVLSEFDL